jgi:hypothetical protein
MAPFTVTGTLTGVNPDNVTLYDTSRAEAGPTGGVTVTGVTNANPGVVTLANNNLALANGQAITIAGVLGPTLINTVTLARNPTSASPYTFQLGIDTTNTTTYPPYSSGGMVTALGADSGYFDYGLITFTSGLNNGLSMEIKSYVPGQLTLYLPMPYQPAIGDTYSLKAGCDKAFATCKTKFTNVVNFRGEPYLPGIDKLVQVGRSQ